MTANVFLRSVSGHSVKELGAGPLPADLSPYRATPEARTRAVRAFEQLGFQVHEEDLALTVSIEGPAALFSKVFGISTGELLQVRAEQTVRLQAPAALRDLVEDVAVVPKPEFFAG